MAKFIIVCGGVISGTGKGVASASIGLLLKSRGHKVTAIKFDGYIGSASTLSPTEHGEVFLCDDGSETDLDLGYMERLIGITTNKNNICTSGTLMKELITEQENGVYLGSTVQIFPHYTQKVINRLESLSKDNDIVMVEIGGTVGDIESAAYYEAIREFKQKHPKDVILIMVAPILWIPTIQEFKTKPLQNSLRELQHAGLQADVLLCRVDRPVPDKILDKISKLTGIERDCIFDAPDVKSIYEVPIEYYNRHVDDICVDLLNLKRSYCRIHRYKELLDKPAEYSVNIGVVGKYANSTEAYLSIKEALIHAGIHNSAKIEIKWIDAQEIEQKGAEALSALHGVIIPGGFDKRGVEGKIKAIQYAREHKLPFLGICLGLQCAVIEFARNVLHKPKANSQEFEKDCAEPVVHFVKGQENIVQKSGTMRLGAYDCELIKNTLAFDLYEGKKIISERHRHRLEVNNNYLEEYKKHGLITSGINPVSGLIEIMELDREIHPFFIGTQAHPEFKSKLAEPAPLFRGLVKAAIKKVSK